MHIPDELTGIIDRFLFHNQENGYAVFILHLRNKEMVTVTGHVAQAHQGQQVSLRGAWVMHPKFGKQFEAHECTLSLPTTTVGLKKYLGSGMIKGIGPSYAEKLVTCFGDQVLEIIDKQPERLQEAPGIGAVRAQKIVTAWHDQKEISTIMVFLQGKGISATHAVKIYKTYGQQSLKILQEDPYRLATDIWGIGFKTADQIAHALGTQKNAPQRIRAGIVHTLAITTSTGNLYSELSSLKEQTTTLLEIEEQDNELLLKQALHDVYSHGLIKLISYENNHYLGLSQHYFSEKGTAQKIERLLQYKSLALFDIDAIYTTLRMPAPGDIQLNEEQQTGIITCLQNKITIITGGPGTGKTTLIKKLLGTLDTYGATYRLAAPTGRAAQRITEGTGRHASTLHRLLEYDFSTRSFKYNDDHALKLDFLIVDEASMIDIFLAHALVKAMPLHAHLVLIGDVDQLPSVGAGNVLNDLIATNKIPCIRLKQIFRQAHDSLIVVNAHKINNGEFPVSFLPQAKRDFIFIKEDNAENLQHHINAIFSSTLPSHRISPEHAIILTPMNRGNAGTQKINVDVQNLLNGAPGAEITHRGTRYKIDDRVMQIRNNYDKLVFNGDTGIIKKIDDAEKLLHIEFGDRVIEYDYHDLDELTLAYAITIHKSQGSEYQAVIIPIFMQHFTLLQRNLLYTAITRAKKLCILIGQPKAIGMAIRNNKGVKRITFLQQFLTSDLTCR